MCAAESSCRERGRCGFTLVELLAVLAIVAIMVAFLVRPGRFDGKAASLRSAQAGLANLIALARIRASASGQTTRMLVNIDVTAAAAAERYLRQVVVQVSTSSGWETVTEIRLPTGVFILPGNFSSIPFGLLSPAADAWVRVDGVSPLRSTVLRTAMITNEGIDGGVAEQWVSVAFSAVGTTAQSGDLVLAMGERRAPGTYSMGQSPVELRNPDAARGLTVSSYGVTALIEDRRSF